MRVFARQHVDLFGIVDSGASGSLLPKRLAQELGIDDTELTEDTHTSGGVGSVFATWSSSVPIHGQVFYRTPTGQLAFGQHPSGFHPFGRPFLLVPGFKEGDCPILLGRSDFFAAFGVSFDHNRGQPVFHLDE